jgi:hypothetical protein
VSPAPNHSNAEKERQPMPIYHKHHIIPKHMGGTDDPSNLVSVTVEEHANLHKQLWEDLGHWQDRIAWLALSGQIKTSEITDIINQKISEKLKTLYNNGLVPWNKGKIDIYSIEQRENLRNLAKKQRENMTSEEKELHSIKSGKGAKWYTNGSEEMWIKPEENIPEGWILGRNPVKKETKEKSRKSHLGQTPWNKGVKGKQVAWNKGLKKEKTL